MKTKILKATMLCFLALVGMSSASQAQFEINNSKEEVKVSSIPFVVALRKIVPIDYDFSFETNSDLSQMVSYRYGNDWESTLSEVLSGVNLDYKIENDVVKIYSPEEVVEVVEEAPVVTEEVAEVVEEAPVVTEEVAEVVEEAPLVTEEVAEVVEEAPVVTEEVAEVVEEASVVTEEVAETLAPDEEQYIWEVKRNFTLQETIKSWGEQVGWNVIWDSDRDFNIQAEASFTGNFVEAASQLIKAFEDADPPVVGTFYKNKTLVIETTSNGEVN